MNGPTHKGQPLRLDEEASSADPALPAFIARPPNSPAYYGFPLLKDSEIDGFVFGTITEPNGIEPAEWGDAYVVAPNGSRAGIVWQVGNGDPSVEIEPSEGRWGVYRFYFDVPITSETELVTRLHSILPDLKAYYAAAEASHPESTRAI
jgi:hypothetical protein